MFNEKVIILAKTNKDKKENEIKELGEMVTNLIKELRDYFKYLVTVSIAFIPIIIGVAGFLLKDQEITTTAIGFLVAGLAIIFLTIPFNILNYLPTYYPVDIESAKLLFDWYTEKKNYAVILTFALIFGMAFSFLGTILIVL